MSFRRAENEPQFKYPEMPRPNSRFERSSSKQYTREDMIKVRRYLETTSRMDHTTFLNGTNCDVTLNLLNNTTRLTNSIYEDEFTRLQGEKSILLGDVRQTELDNQINIYINRRPLNNMKHKITDNWVPFSDGWEIWVPDAISHEEALLRAESFLETIKRLNWQKSDIFLTELMAVNHCKVCSFHTPRSVEILAHFLSQRHINNIYRNKRAISILDVLVLEKMIGEIMKMRDICDEMPNPPMGYQKYDGSDDFFETCSTKNCFDSLKSLTTLTGKIPMMNEMVKGQKCEYVETILTLEKLYKQASKLPMLTLIQPIVNEKCFHLCGVCGVNVQIYQLKSFFEHIFTAEHLEKTYRNGLNRNEAEYWYDFCESNSTESGPKNLPDASKKENLQKERWPLCVAETPIDDDLVFEEHQKGEVVRIVKSLFKKKCLMKDKVFKNTLHCEWCNEELSTKLHFIEHVIYSPKHLRNLPVYFVDDFRYILLLGGVYFSAPLLSIPNGPVLDRNQIVSESSVPNLIEEFKKLIVREPYERLCMKEEIALVNYCELCEVKLDYVDHIIDHLKGKKHWEANKYTRRTYDDFKFWFNNRRH